MEYWQFLLQKEGDRSWKPLESPKIELEAGRYRVVAHSSRTNSDVEICVIHHSTGEVPPRRRSQKRSRRTNPEGLMVVIPFTYLKPGLWELRCGGDIMSDFLGNSWQHAVQMKVLPNATEVLPTDEPTSSGVNAIQTSEPEDSRTPLPSNTDPTPTVERVASSTLKSNPDPTPTVERVASSTLKSNPDPTPTVESTLSTTLTSSADPTPTLEPLPVETELVFLTPPTSETEIRNHSDWGLEVGEEVPSYEESENDEARENLQPNFASSVLPYRPITEIPSLQLPDPLELLESAENPESFTSNSAEMARLTNPILDHSLQMLEDILQQVLEPVLEEFDRAESPESEILIPPAPELLLEPDNDIPGLTLTLNEDSFVAQRGEPLTITGQLYVLDTEAPNGHEASSTSNHLFQGTLRYELRDPQNSNVLLDIQCPLTEQLLPVTFSHTLEIPPDCKTRLILGKVTLYGSTPVALVSQAFTITANLDELLGAIIPGSKAMPVAKMLVLADNLGAIQNNWEELLESAEAASEQLELDLIHIPPTLEPLPLQPVSREFLPPQLSQSTGDRKSAKAPQLPIFPTVQSGITTAESSTNPSLPNGVEVKQKDSVEPSVSHSELPNSQRTDVAEETAPELHSQLSIPQLEEGVQPEIVPAEDVLSNLWDETEASTPSVPITNSEAESSKLTEIPKDSELTIDQSVNIAETTDALVTATPPAESQLSNLETTLPESQSEQVQETEAAATEPDGVENAFQLLNIQDRFWWRLNSLATDAQLSEWLKSELPDSSSSDEIEEASQLFNADLNADPELIEIEDVTPQLDSDTVLADFDESIWEESDEFNSESDDHELTDTSMPELPALDEEMFLEQELPEPPSLTNVTEIDWDAREIVVEDEELLTPEYSAVRQDASGVAYPTEQPIFQPSPRIPSSLESELPLPAPDIFVPTGELAAGEPVTLRIKLQPHPARLSVKLWVQDRQSRSLLDGPRWLVDLIPDGSGYLEAMTQLIVPLGSVEIRFEAIAVDIYTQRESPKVAVDCVVVPPNLPSFSLDEFEA